MLFRVQTQVLGGGAGGDDQGIAAVFAGIAAEAKGLLLQNHRVDMVEDDLGTEALGMTLHTFHQFGALYPFSVAGPVVYVGGGRELATLLDTGDQHRIEIGACGIDGGGISGGTRTQDQQAAVFDIAHVKSVIRN